MQTIRPAVASTTWTLLAVFGPNVAADPAASLPSGGAPPDGAIVLFDGKGTNLFVSRTGGPIDWPVVHGALVSAPNSRRSNNVVSRLHFRDAQIHVEFWLPPAGDGNSGVYLLGEYELQILNAAGDGRLHAGGMGALYGLRAPLANPALGAGQWQAFDVVLRAPRWDARGRLRATGEVTAWLNGQLIHDDQPLGRETSDYNPYRYDATPYLDAVERRQRRTSAGPLILQDHDNPVRFRNIWVTPLDCCACLYSPSALAPAARKDRTAPRPQPSP
jgi:hypothetical protein